MLYLSLNLLLFTSPSVIHKLRQYPLVTYLLSGMIAQLPLQPTIHSLNMPSYLKPVHAIGSQLIRDLAW